VNQKPSSERIVRDIRRATRKQYSAEEKIRIVLDGLGGEHRVAELRRITTGRRSSLEAGKRRLTGDTARAATSGEVKELRQEAKAWANLEDDEQSLCRIRRIGN
jgi:transposase